VLLLVQALVIAHAGASTTSTLQSLLQNDVLALQAVGVAGLIPLLVPLSHCSRQLFHTIPSPHLPGTTTGQAASHDS
jgi:hypothetical protein